MDDVQEIESPQVDQNDQTPQEPVSGGDDKLRLLHTAVGHEYNLGSFEEFKQKMQNPDKRKQFYDAVGKHYNLGTYDQFESKIGGGKQSTPISPVAPPPPEHEVIHNPIQDIRHLNEMANLPVRSTTTTLDPTSGSSVIEDNKEDVERNKQYQQQYENSVQGIANTWGTDVNATKQTFKDFGDEQDENKLKKFATLAKQNPVAYSRLKDANDIRIGIAKSGQLDAIHDANIFNDLQQSADYQDLQHNIALQQEILTKHGLGQQYFEKLKNTQAPLINALDPGLLTQYWNSNDKKLGLSDFQYAGLETEKMFQPDLYKRDLAIIQQNKGLDQNGQPIEGGQAKKGYEYDRGVENVLFRIENQGRQNTQRFISQRNPEVTQQIDNLTKDYQNRINATTDPAVQRFLLDQFHNNPLIQEAAKLDDGQQQINYAESEDQRRFPLNFNDQATRLVKDAMDHTSGVMGTTGDWFNHILLGAGGQADNTIRFIKNTYINLLGSQQDRAVQQAKDIGHQSLTSLSEYEPQSYTGAESPLIIPQDLIKKVQEIQGQSGLSNQEKEAQSISLIKDNFDEIKANPKAGQQNLTFKSGMFTAANTIGQILGIADQSMLMGGLLGDAAKAKQMASALVPMYTSTQNQLYEQALANGDEKPLLKSSIDAAIISLASLINPDFKVVKGMVGAETGLGKIIGGVDETTWNKVLSTNKPLVDRMLAGTKATARQLGLANLQYGIIVPTAQYLVHKNVFNEDPNLGDSIKDGLIQTTISMAIPAITHGIWGGIRATEVNPYQKGAIVEAGLHAKENIDLIDGQVERGQITPDKAVQIKDVIKQTEGILKHTEFSKTDGTPMNDQEVNDVVYNMLRKKTLEGKLKNAPDPQKPIIEDRIHELDKTISDLHTSDEEKHKTELNTLLSDNIERIRKNEPALEEKIKEAIAKNQPEEIMQLIADRANETKTVEGKEVNSKSETEEIFGKKLVDKAIEFSKKGGKPTEAKSPETTPPNGEGDNATPASSPSSISVIRPGEMSKPEIITIKPKDNASDVRSNPGQGSQGGQITENGQDNSGQNIQQQEETGNAQPQQQAGQGKPVSGEEVNPDALPFGKSDNIGIAHEYQKERAYDLNVTPTERGQGITLEQSIQRGRDLIAQGVDPQEVFNNFQKDGRISWEDMSVVRARNEQLAREANAAVDQYGENSEEAKAAIKKEREWYSTVVKPMQTEWSRIGIAQQGKTDIDTGSVSGLRRAYMDASGKDFTPEQEAKAKELADKVKELTDKQKVLEGKIDKLLNENKELKSDKNIKESAKELAKKIRKGKLSRPDSFSAASPASLVWDTAVEIVASTIEAGGTLAQAIADGLAHVRESDWYKGLTEEEQKQAESQFTEYHNHVDEPDKALAEKYADKKGNKFTHEEGKEIWEHVKSKYLDKGMELPDAIKGTSTDLGLTAEQIIHAMATPKGAKEITTEMFKVQYNRRKAMNSARYFVGNADKNGLVKALNKVPSIFFNLKTWGHGTVGNITHAGPNIFRPSTWKAYWPNVAKSFQLAYGTTGNYEKAITILKNSPNFNEWLQAGLAADPNKTYDEYQMMGKPENKTAAGRTIQWLNETGTRGFSGLNFMRYDMAEMLYNKASDAAKADPDFRAQVAELVNHATGHSEVRVPKALKVITFAPGLEISRWQRMITDPAHAIKTFGNWKNASDADKAAAKIVAQGAGEKLAVYGTLLAANAGLLAAMNSKQKVNFSDPAKSDWLRFKFANKTLDVSGNILSPIRLLSVLLTSAKNANFGNKKDVKTKPGDKDANTLTQQARYKLSPVAGTATDLGTGTDAMGNVLPWSKVKPSPGRHKMTWKELISKEALPIPVAAGLEAYWTSMEKSGMHDSQIEDIMNGLLLFGTEGFTGAKLQDDYSLEKKKK